MGSVGCLQRGWPVSDWVVARRRVRATSDERGTQRDIGGGRSNGSYIAISETTTLSIGNARDVVYVLRTEDGADVFRRYLPHYSRSQVVFFDGGFMGYSDLEGTHILKIPTQ